MPTPPFALRPWMALLLLSPSLAFAQTSTSSATLDTTLVTGNAVQEELPTTSRTDAKTSDHFFTGFPSYWNIVALYMVAVGLSPATNALILLAFVALVFIPIGYIYPSRTSRWQGPTVVLGALWGLEMAVIIWQLPEPSRWLVRISFVYPVYYFAVSLLLHRARPKAARSAVQ